MLRSRDFVAALALVFLTFSARDLDDVTATIQLAFYAPHGMKDDPTVQPVVFDVDGDGKSEALAMWTPEWKLKVLDLRPASLAKTGLQTAFVPKTLLESARVVPPEPSEASKTENNEELVVFEPVAMTTGQVVTRNLQSSKNQRQEQNAKPPSDKTLQYFCGVDWHDASERCAVHCPSGQSNDCPDTERCFADTPCRADSPSSSSQETTSRILDSASAYHTTPAGSWPSIFTVWSIGNVTLHSVTSEQNAETKKSNKKPKLDLQLLWNVAPLVPKSYTMEWEDVAVTFVDTTVETARAGLLLITGTASAVPNKQPELDTIDELEYVWGTFTLALEVLTGKIAWTSFSSKELELALIPKEEEEKLPLPMVASRGSTSLARRRSLTAGLLSNGNVARTMNCWSEFRHSVLTAALPYQYWGATVDTTVSAVHFDHETPKPKKKTKPKSHHNHHHNHASAPQKKNWFESKKKKKERHLHYGRPNVVVAKNHEGLQVLSLKNGKPICHLSLRPHTLYTDLNHDGTLDSIQIVTGEQEVTQDDDAAKKERQWMENLARRFHAAEDKETNLTSAEAIPPRLCHIMALAGVPAKEELFSAPLCLHHNHDHIESAPLLVLQHGKKQDIITSVNTGEIARWAASGRRVWHWQYGFGTWNDPSLVLLERVEAPLVVENARPLVWAGEESVALVSAETGEILDHAPFIQTTELRPQKVDFNGDGISDVLMVTADAVFGYVVDVQTNGSVLFRLGYGLLLMGLMVAVLRNQLGPRPGKRSTDL